MGFREQVILKMVDFEKGCPKRIQHFLKVYEFAHLIAEADFLVNAYEDDMDKKAILTVRDRIFRTRMGTELLNTMFGLGEVS